MSTKDLLQNLIRLQIDLQTWGVWQYENQPGSMLNCRVHPNLTLPCMEDKKHKISLRAPSVGTILDDTMQDLQFSYLFILCILCTYVTSFHRHVLTFPSWRDSHIDIVIFLHIWTFTVSVVLISQYKRMYMFKGTHFNILTLRLNTYSIYCTYL